MSRRWFGVKSFIGRRRWKVRTRIGHDLSSKGMKLKGCKGVLSPGRCVAIDLPTGHAQRLYHRLSTTSSIGVGIAARATG